MRKYSTIFAVFFLILFNNSYAQEKSFEVYSNFGYTQLSGFSYSQSSKVMNTFNGLHFGVSALYNINTEYVISPIIGSGINIFATKNANTIESDNIKGSFNFATIAVTGGLKLRYLKNVPIYFLGNFGYAPLNLIEFYSENKNSYIGKALSNNNFKGKNHYFYGASIMSKYNFTSNFSLGGTLTYNRHSMDLEKETLPETTTERSAFNEYSFSLIAMWAFN